VDRGEREGGGVKKSLLSMMLALFLLSFASFASLSAGEETIGALFANKIRDKVPVKVYIKEVVNQSGQEQMLPKSFREALAHSFHQRRSIRFEVVNDPAGSDIQISAVIKKYQYLERGPFKPNPGLGTMLLEAAATATQNYVEMSVEYTVSDTKTDKRLWQRTINEYIKKNMTPEGSIPLIYNAVTKTFIWKCFGKVSLR
jgi:hypothetical protein